MLFILNQNNRVIGTLNNESPEALPYWNDRYNRTLEPIYQSFSFETIGNHQDSIFLMNENSILKPTGKGEYHHLKIKIVEDDNHNGKPIRRVFCESVSVLDLLGFVVNPMEFELASLTTVLNAILAGTRWTVAPIQGVTNKAFKLDRHTNALYALRQALEIFDVEVEYTVELRNNQVFRNNIHVTPRIGADNGVRFVYGENLIGARRTRDTRELMTSIVGIGADGITLADLPAEADVAQLLNNDDMSRDGRMLISNRSFQMHSSDGHHVTGLYENSSIDDPFELLHATYNYFIDKIEPRNTYEIDIALLHQLDQYQHRDVNIGDTIIVQDMTFNPPILISARIIELTVSETSPEDSNVVIGDVISLQLTDASLFEVVQTQIRDAENQWRETNDMARDALERADDLEGRVTDAEENISDLEDDVDDLDERLTETETDVDDLEKRVDEAEKDIDDLEDLTGGWTYEDTSSLDGGAIQEETVRFEHLIADFFEGYKIRGAIFEGGLIEGATFRSSLNEETNHVVTVTHGAITIGEPSHQASVAISDQTFALFNPNNSVFSFSRMGGNEFNLSGANGGFLNINTNGGNIIGTQVSGGNVLMGNNGVGTTVSTNFHLRHNTINVATLTANGINIGGNRTTAGTRNLILQGDAVREIVSFTMGGSRQGAVHFNASGNAILAGNNQAVALRPQAFNSAAAQLWMGASGNATFTHWVSAAGWTTTGLSEIELDGNALDIINSTDKKRVGLSSNDIPDVMKKEVEIIGDDGDVIGYQHGVDECARSNIMWKAIQEMSQKINELEQELKSAKSQ